MNTFTTSNDKCARTNNIIVFPKLYKKVSAALVQNNAFIVQGQLDLTSTTKCKIKAEQIIPIEQFFEQWSDFKKAIITLQTPPQPELLTQLNSHKGKTPVTIRFRENEKYLTIELKLRVQLSLDFVNQTAKWCDNLQIII